MNVFLPRLVALVLAVCLSFVSVSSYSQPTKAKTSGNIYTKWITLALVGKNQAEIEFFFRNEKNQSIEQVKRRIRHAVVENLRRAGIRQLIEESADVDDLNVVIRKIIIEIRYAGMELDKDLRLSIKEEFGVQLERL
ncbi:MAG: hypothetical protein HQ517_06455 [SAR324 cluster bacterium]|nr:hypothetical protein [SAR324 cluster bacterium]